MQTRAWGCMGFHGSVEWESGHGNPWNGESEGESPYRMSQCTTCQEWAKLSKSLPCSMVGIVIYCAESENENEAEVGQKNKKNICTTRQLHNEGLRHYLIRWCTYETTITEPPFCNLSLSVFFYFFVILMSLWNYWDLGEMMYAYIFIWRYSTHYSL